MREIPVTVLMIVITLAFALMGFGFKTENPEELKNIVGSAITEVNINHKGYTRVIVAVKNNSYKNFNGQIKITSLDEDHKSLLGFDTFYTETLTPGQTIHWITWITVAKVPNLKVEAVDGKFTSF